VLHERVAISKCNALTVGEKIPGGIGLTTLRDTFWERGREKESARDFGGE
jgi:hypothetical protein